MLRSLKELRGYDLKARDGSIGRCADFLLDDETWTVRYMVADTRKWLPGRQVLVTPIALGDPDWQRQEFPVRLTRDQIQAAPELDEHAPVTRRYETWYHEHFGWPAYWQGTGLWGSMAVPRALFQDGEGKIESGPELEEPHLYLASEVMKYSLRATDGEIGHVEDFILDDEHWTVRHLVAATRDWLPGKKVLIPSPRLERVSWQDAVLEVGLSREKVADSPPYDPSLPVNREVEERIYDYVGRPRDWS